MKLFSKDTVILVLLVGVTMFMTLFYRERQVVILKDKIEKTESLLRGVKWAPQARDYLLKLDYNIPEPEIAKVDTTKEEK